jgi:DNA-binding NarL/FixJ family response regulator
METSIQAPCRVLLADDTPEIRMLVRLALELEGGFEIVAEAADGAEALHLSDQHQPDAVVLDLAMPVMDGLEAIPAIKKGNPNIKILVLSGFDAPKMMHEAMEAGADAYLEKGEPAHKIVQLLQGFYPNSVPKTAADPSDLVVANLGPSAPIPDIPDLRVKKTEKAERDTEALSALAHELMTPVTVVRGFAETLADRAGSLDVKTIEEWARTIARNAGNMASIIRSFRETAELESGETDLDIEPVELVHAVAETLSDLSAMVGGRDILLDAPASLEVLADPVKVRQILANLISNAVKFSPAGTPIEISVLAGAFYAEICIRDHGRGIAPHKAGALFTKYARLDAPEPGSGLGLYICRRLARSHGGEVVFREADGGGAKFCLRLPLPA